MRRKRSRAPAIVLIVIAVTAVYLLATRNRLSVDWSATRAALLARQTVHGQGTFRGDGADWAFAIWGAVRSGGSYVSRGMLVPPGSVGSLPVEQAPEPPQEALRISSAMDYLGQEGLVTQLLAAHTQPARVRSDKWGGEPVLLAEVEHGGLIWVIALAPDTHLILSMDAYLLEGDARRLLATCRYVYDEPLPPGFDQAPG